MILLRYLLPLDTEGRWSVHYMADFADRYAIRNFAISVVLLSVYHLLPWLFPLSCIHATLAGFFLSVAYHEKKPPSKKRGREGTS
jgi:hypothetical protein